MPRRTTPCDTCYGRLCGCIFSWVRLFVLDGQDLVTAFTCSASSLGNIGPGLGGVGPYDNYAGLSMTAKWVSALLMLLGRLELFTLLALLSPFFFGDAKVIGQGRRTHSDSKASGARRHATKGMPLSGSPTFT